MTDSNVVPLREALVENPMRQQILDHVAQVLDNAPHPPTAIVFAIIGGDYESDSLSWLCQDGMKVTPLLAYCQARLNKTILEQLE